MGRRRGTSGSNVEYLDFEIEVGEAVGARYPVRVVRSPDGAVASAEAGYPFSELQRENYELKLQTALSIDWTVRASPAPSPEVASVKEFGEALFRTLFQDEVRSRFEVNREKAEARGKGLRVKLAIRAPELASLPWEYLFDPHMGDFMCLSRYTPIVRYLDIPRSVQPLTVTPPLRILAAIASPSDLPKLDVERERQRVERALEEPQRNGSVSLTWLEGETSDDLHQTMLRHDWHVFHFIGHGGFDRMKNEGVIALCDANGASAPLLASQLGTILGDHRTLRLVVLNSCEGARGSDQVVLSSTASILIRKGIPAVIGMQQAISDRAAILFARSLYQAIGAGEAVDAAVGEARQAISINIANSLEWGTPVLFMRSPDGVLFRLKPRAEGAAEPAPHEEPAAVAAPPVPAPPLAPPVVPMPVKPAEPEPRPAPAVIAPVDPAKLDVTTWAGASPPPKLPPPAQEVRPRVPDPVAPAGPEPADRRRGLRNRRSFVVLAAVLVVIGVLIWRPWSSSAIVVTDFAKGVQGWGAGPSGQCTFGLSNGSYVIGTSAANLVCPRFAPGDAQQGLADTRIAVDASAVQGSVVVIGAFCRDADGQYDGALLYTDGSWLLERYVGSNGTDLAKGSTKAFGLDETQHLVLSCGGQGAQTKLKLYLNGTLLGQTTDPKAATTGGVGIIGGNGSVGADSVRAAFDRVEVDRGA